jgi:hypothetical protein
MKQSQTREIYSNSPGFKQTLKIKPGAVGCSEPEKCLGYPTNPDLLFNEVMESLDSNNILFAPKVIEVISDLIEDFSSAFQADSSFNVIAIKPNQVGFGKAVNLRTFVSKMVLYGFNLCHECVPIWCGIGRNFRLVRKALQDDDKLFIPTPRVNDDVMLFYQKTEFRDTGITEYGIELIYLDFDSLIQPDWQF